MSTRRRMKMTCDGYDELIRELINKKRWPTEVEKGLLSGHRRVCADHHRDPGLDELAATMYVEEAKKPEPIKLRQCFFCNKVCLHSENKWYTEQAMEHRFRDDNRFVLANIEYTEEKEYCDVCGPLFNSDTTFESSDTTYTDEPPT